MSGSFWISFGNWGYCDYCKIMKKILEKSDIYCILTVAKGQKIVYNIKRCENIMRTVQAVQHKTGG